MAPADVKAILAKLEELSGDVRELIVHVKGNGGRGLQQRMDDLEEWRKTHPHPCPLDRDEMHKRRMREIALYGVVVAAVSLAVNLGMRLLGG